MVHRIRKTSLEAYRTIKIIPTAMNVLDAIRVLQANKKRGCTDKEILYYLREHGKSDWELGVINARRYWLVENGLVEQDGLTKNEASGIMNLTWREVMVEWDKDFVDEKRLNKCHQVA